MNLCFTHYEYVKRSRTHRYDPFPVYSIYLNLKSHSSHQVNRNTYLPYSRFSPQHHSR